MAIAVTSIGAKVLYAVEETAGKRPITGYTAIPGITEIPDMDSEPEYLETTTMDNLEYKTYVAGLKDLGGALQFVANLSQELLNMWNGVGGMMEKYATAKDGGKAMWMCVYIPGLEQAVYFQFEPSPIGLMGTGVNEVIDVNLYVTPTSEPIWQDVPTDLAAEALAAQASTMNYKY